jgi:hypothetical protein
VWKNIGETTLQLSLDFLRLLRVNVCEERRPHRPRRRGHEMKRTFLRLRKISFKNRHSNGLFERGVLRNRKKKIIKKLI